MSDLLELLAQHKTIGDVPRRELEWLAEHGTLTEFPVGQQVSSKDAEIESLHIVLRGRIAIYIDRGSGPAKGMEWREGDVAGALPYSRLKNPPGNTFAEEDTTALSVHRDLFPELVRECQQVTTRLVHKMLDRTRAFTSSDLMDEKLKSLGKLSAGLAHELNNPASAIERSAVLLEEKLDQAERATLTLGAARLDDRQIAAVEAVRSSCAISRRVGVRSPIEQAEHEEAIADWLTARGLDPDLSETLADTAVTFVELDRIAAAVDANALDAVMRWVAAGCAVRELASEIQEAALRIAGLVMAIKGFTHMDQSPTAGPVDLRQGLANTVAVLRSKARKKSVAVEVKTEDDLPKVRGFVGELNQVWGNLIDNALDAVPEAGRIEVFAGRERDKVVVRFVDNGSGIPKEIVGRIFDPFFTTKPMGQGTGLGLDIVKRLVIHNEGDIRVESEPGRTEFCVTLPIASGDEAR